jgi:hypothetical protein
MWLRRVTRAVEKESVDGAEAVGREIVGKCPRVRRGGQRSVAVDCRANTADAEFENAVKNREFKSAEVNTSS